MVFIPYTTCRDPLIAGLKALVVISGGSKDEDVPPDGPAVVVDSEEECGHATSGGLSEPGAIGGQ